ncbi:MAG TPA: hypothetical protein PK752_01500 [Accumulibacter sp.]|uniref:hypothetical protein n=1 Tax=Accumulibacter sp. TaxID=2053492 RepID=UPI002B945B7A|nr:hypothetical protein [Accumulibacter sp.]HRD86922.1 hypothetical protein [Accumulibacter sp.]
MQLPPATLPARLSTEQLAALFHVRPESIRAGYCRLGHWNSLKPIKQPNRMLLWPADAAERLLRGEAA